MEYGIYILALITGGIAGYYLTQFLFKKFLGELLYAVDGNGKRHRVLKRPKESLTSAIGRLKQKMISEKIPTIKWGILFRWSSLWVGAHWSPYNKRLCVNMVPFVTVWLTARGGEVQNKGFDIYRSSNATPKASQKFTLVDDQDRIREDYYAQRDQIVSAAVREHHQKVHQRSLEFATRVKQINDQLQHLSPEWHQELIELMDRLTRRMASSGGENPEGQHPPDTQAP